MRDSEEGCAHHVSVLLVPRRHTNASGQVSLGRRRTPTLEPLYPGSRTCSGEWCASNALAWDHATFLDAWGGDNRSGDEGDIYVDFIQRRSTTLRALLCRLGVR